MSLHLTIQEREISPPYPHPYPYPCALRHENGSPHHFIPLLHTRWASASRGGAVPPSPLQAAWTTSLCSSAAVCAHRNLQPAPRFLSLGPRGNPSPSPPPAAHHHRCNLPTPVVYNWDVSGWEIKKGLLCWMDIIITLGMAYLELHRICSIFGNFGEFWVAS